MHTVKHVGMLGAEVLPAKGFETLQQLDRRFVFANPAIGIADCLENLCLDQGLLREALFDLLGASSWAARSSSSRMVGFGFAFGSRTTGPHECIGLRPRVRLG